MGQTSEEPVTDQLDGLTTLESSKTMSNPVSVGERLKVIDSICPDLKHEKPSSLFDRGLNRLLQGDCLDVMNQLPDESLDLIYIDPPFATGREHIGIKRVTKHAPAFSDIWSGGVDAFVDWLALRLRRMHGLLKSTGGIYVHLDWRASHYVKCVMDKIFAGGVFRNELYWRRDIAGKGAKKISGQWPRNADTILVYSKSPIWNFNQPYKELTPEQRANYRYQEPDGRRFRTVQLGDYSKASIERMNREGLIYTSKTGKQYKKYYLDEAKSAIDCIWTDIPGFGTRTAASEWTGYPTQKPLALLDRIVAASSRPGDVVADFFCGSGTTCVSATALNRRWIGVDQSTEAIEVASKRLRDAILRREHGSAALGRAPTNDAKQLGLFNVNAKQELAATTPTDKNITNTVETWHAGFTIEKVVPL